MTANETGSLVEHYFRHEYGRLVGLLTSGLGIRHLELAEDVVQQALWRALQVWSRQGIPAAPGAWLYRTARNLAIDELRRQRTFQVKAERLVTTATLAELPDCRSDHELPDERLRLLFLCCHEALSTESQIALALKLAGGFGVREIAAGMLVGEATIEKRLTRAKLKLQEIGQELAELNHQQMRRRLPAVMHTLYLLFNEGFASSSGSQPTNAELCQEAIRQVRMILSLPEFAEETAVCALLALMLLHIARMSTRVDEQQCIVLLAAQNRQQWSWETIREGMHWMQQAARGSELSRYHVEAAIAWEHCRASSLFDTDWPQVVSLYELLERMAPSAMVRLNLAIAQSYTAGVENALKMLLAIDAADRRQLRPWWDCAMAELWERSGDLQRAATHWRDALALAGNTASRGLIQSRLDALLER